MNGPRYFVYKLIPPRPTFAADATEKENEVMGQHAGYWQGLTAQGKVLIFGPVAFSSGAWGLGVVRADEERELHDIAAADPAITSGLCTYEVGSMPRAVVPAQHDHGARHRSLDGGRRGYRDRLI
jgi:uncharacterized protein YciI